MADVELTTRTIGASEARQKWSDVLDRVWQTGERVIVEKGGIPVAAIISASDLERFHQLERGRARDFAILEEIGGAFKDETPEESERLARQAVAEARAAHRRQHALQEP